MRQITTEELPNCFIASQRDMVLRRFTKMPLGVWTEYVHDDRFAYPWLYVCDHDCIGALNAWLHADEIFVLETKD